MVWLSISLLLARKAHAGVDRCSIQPTTTDVCTRWNARPCKICIRGRSNNGKKDLQQKLSGRVVGNKGWQSYLEQQGLFQEIIPLVTKPV